MSLLKRMGVTALMLLVFGCAPEKQEIVEEAKERCNPKDFLAKYVPETVIEGVQLYRLPSHARADWFYVVGDDFVGNVKAEPTGFAKREIHAQIDLPPFGDPDREIRAEMSYPRYRLVEKILKEKAPDIGSLEEVLDIWREDGWKGDPSLEVSNPGSDEYIQSCTYLSKLGRKSEPN